MSEVKNTAEKLAVKNKLLFVFCISFIMLSLFTVCYLFFFRSITIDVTKDMNIAYSGESGSGSILVSNNAHNLNQRTQDFLNSITYQVSPNRNLSNGTQVTVEAKWSEELANKYNIEVINNVKEITVEGLVERYQDQSKIPSAFIETLDQRADTYFERNMNTILKEDFQEFYVTSNTTLKERKLVYRVFLQAIDAENKDKIVDIYAIEANGKINKAVDHEELVDGTSTIYYTLTYDNIDNAQKLEDEDIYGEKMIAEAIESQEDLVTALKGKYLLSYTMSILK